MRKLPLFRVLLTDTDTVATGSIPAYHKASPGSRSCHGIALITYYCGVIARLTSSITYISMRWCRQSSTTFNKAISGNLFSGLSPLVTNGLFHPYHLGDSTFILRVIRSMFSFSFHFSIKIMFTSIQNNPRRNVPFLRHVRSLLSM